MMRVVVALGGNSLVRPGKNVTYQELQRNIRATLAVLFKVLKSSDEVVLVSGSGPQIGALLLQNELARSQVPQMPLDVLDAQLEGELGYLLEQNLHNLFFKLHVKRPVVSVLTQVLVNKRDPAFKNPTKPVGRFYTKKEAELLKKKEGWVMVEQFGEGYRRVVPSPKPLSVDDVGMIDVLLKHRAVVIAVGGGGIPVVKERDAFKGVECVIDKDLASACLASALNADMLLILTGESCAYLSYRKKDQRPLKHMTVKQAEQYAREGHFPSGSMGPKIAAGIEFLKRDGNRVIITSPSHLERALRGASGTVMTRV